VNEHNSPAYAEGRAHKQAQNDALASCPANFIDTYDPSRWGGYNIMYDRGFYSIEQAIAHSCKKCDGSKEDR
jgi:hypothetical protein